MGGPQGAPRHTARNRQGQLPGLERAHLAGAQPLGSQGWVCAPREAAKAGSKQGGGKATVGRGAGSFHRPSVPSPSKTSAPPPTVARAVAPWELCSTHQ